MSEECTVFSIVVDDGNETQVNLISFQTQGL